MRDCGLVLSRVVEHAPHVGRKRQVGGLEFLRSSRLRKRLVRPTEMQEIDGAPQARKPQVRIQFACTPVIPLAFRISLLELNEHMSHGRLRLGQFAVEVDGALGRDFCLGENHRRRLDAKRTLSTQHARQ